MLDGRGTVVEGNTVVKYNTVPVHRFCERWLYRYGGDSELHTKEQERAPFRALTEQVDAEYTISIPGWREHRGKGVNFVQFCVLITWSTNGPSWTVRHRYSDFEKLHEKLFKSKVPLASRSPTSLPREAATAYNTLLNYLDI